MEAFRRGMQHPVEGCKDIVQTEEGYYSERTKDYTSENPKFNGWSSKFSQYRRFDIIVEELTKDAALKGHMNSQICILDVGCGGKELRKVLPKDWIYVGIDKRPEIEGTDFATLEVKDLPTRPEYIVFSGTFAFIEIPEVEKMIEKAVNMAKSGVIFNLLDAKCDELTTEPVIYVHKKRFFSYIYNKYRIQQGLQVTMRDEYFPNEDFTIFIRQFHYNTLLCSNT